MEEPRRVEMEAKEAEELLARVEKSLGEEDYEKVKGIFESYVRIIRMLENNRLIGPSPCRFKICPGLF